jgi:plastocyanin
MTQNTDLDRRLAAWLRPGPTGLSARSFDRIVDEISMTSQRRHLRLLRGRGSPAPLIRFAAIAAATLAVLVSGAWLLAHAPNLEVGGPAVPAVSASPSAPAATPTAAGVGAPLELTVTHFAFDRSDLYAPADAPIEITFTNEDAGIPHSLQVLDASGAAVFTSEVFAGVAQRTFTLPPLPAGLYSFRCQIHPNETGTLHVGETDPATAPPSAAEATPAPDVRVAIVGMGFMPGRVTFTGGQRFSMELVNEDAGVEHGVEILDAMGTSMFRGWSVMGPGTTWYPIDALPDGTYAIRDPIHPDIQGSLVIGP